MTVSEAASSGDTARLRALLEAGGDPNEAETAEYWSPLLEAACTDHFEAARLLLDTGADMYAPNSGGETPLLMAVQQGSMRVFRLLLERGCQMDVQRDNALWMLTQAAGHGHIEIVRWLLAQDVDVNMTDFQGGTALTSAAHSDYLEVVNELLRAGADPNHRDNDTETVLMWAADHAENAGVLRALLQAGAEVNAQNDMGNTALSWVMRHGDPEMVQVLLEAGADIHSDALLRAVHNGFAPAVRLLLEHGADISATDVNGQTALDIAKSRKHRKVANLLRQAAADRSLRETGDTYLPPRYPVGTRVHALTGTPREGWVVRTEWHYKHGGYGYYIEVEGISQSRKTISKRYWEEDLRVMEGEQKRTDPGGR